MAAKAREEFRDPRCGQLAQEIGISQSQSLWTLVERVLAAAVGLLGGLPKLLLIGGGGAPWAWKMPHPGQAVITPPCLHMRSRKKEDASWAPAEAAGSVKGGAEIPRGPPLSGASHGTAAAWRKVPCVCHRTPWAPLYDHTEVPQVAGTSLPRCFLFLQSSFPSFC